MARRARWWSSCVCCYILNLIIEVRCYGLYPVHSLVTAVVHSDAVLSWFADVSGSAGVVAVQCGHAPFGRTPLLARTSASSGFQLTDDAYRRMWYSEVRFTAFHSQAMHGSPEKYNLQIKSVQFNDSVVFACRASFQVGLENPFSQPTNITLLVVDVRPTELDEARSGIIAGAIIGVIVFLVISIAILFFLSKRDVAEPVEGKSSVTQTGPTGELSSLAATSRVIDQEHMEGPADALVQS